MCQPGLELSEPLRCNFPFEYLFVGIEHVYSVCCVGWVDPRYHARITEPRSGWDVWNHQNFRALRSTVLEQRWEQCSACPRIPMGHVHPGLIPEHWQPDMQVGPRTIVLGNDRACQLRCWICRPAPIADTDPAIAKAQQLILDEFLPTAEQLSLSHSGEPFVSPLHRPLLDLDPATYPGLSIELFTNGQRLAADWDTIRARPIIHRVIVSIDAGTGETYRRVRGGDWFRLLNGLATLEQEKWNRPLDLWINMTVNAANFLDIPSFIALGRTFAADRIELKPFLKHWHSADEFNSWNVCSPHHPEHSELLRLIAENREDLDQVDARQLLSACGL